MPLHAITGQDNFILFDDCVTTIARQPFFIGLDILVQPKHLPGALFLGTLNVGANVP